jgi:hypothetical protein
VIRDLFVELGDVLFDEVKQLVLAFEAAIAEAGRQRQVREDAGNERSSRPPDVALKLLVEHARPSWRFVSVWLNPFDRETVIESRLPCGHKAETVLDESAFVRAPSKTAICNYVVARLLSKPRRRCYCVHVPGVL